MSEIISTFVFSTARSISNPIYSRNIEFIGQSSLASLTPNATLPFPKTYTFRFSTLKSPFDTYENMLKVFKFLFIRKKTLIIIISFAIIKSKYCISFLRHSNEYRKEIHIFGNTAIVVNTQRGLQEFCCQHILRDIQLKRRCMK